MFRTRNTFMLLAAVLLSGCATQPMGPTARVMPASGKSFEVFAQEQASCKQFADGEVNGGATMANLKEFGTAAIATGLGGGLGAAIRGQRGAEVGGSLGAVGGAAIAGHGSARDQSNLQGRYDLAYTQCMYTHGNQIAGNPAGGNRTGTAAAANTVPLAAVGSPRSSSGQPVGVP
jgi:hypothetical protein